MLPSALENYRRQQRITAAAVVAARKARGSAVEAAKVVTAFQILAATESAAAMVAMISDQGIDDTAAGKVAPVAVAGVASDGRPLDTLLMQAQADYQFDLMVATQVQDAARAAASVAMVSRPAVSGYVRMLNPPSCSRCAVLAGKWFKWNAGFERHPRCDCRHIPAQEADYSDVRLSGDKWFHTLSPEEQDRIFTKAGAQAVRDGADLGQVVNARRGMQKAQIFGRDAVITTEGTTARGLAFKSLQRGGTYRSAEEFATRYTKSGPELRRVHRTRARSPRVMPETIYEVAQDRADAIRLLKAHGYIT